MDLYAVALNAEHESEPDNWWIEFYWADDDEHAEEQAKNAHPHAAVLCTPTLVPYEPQNPHVEEPA